MKFDWSCRFAFPGSNCHNPLAWGALLGLVVNLLLIPASAKHKDENGAKSDATPLIAAASNCNLDQVGSLLKQGADLKARDRAGRDALTYASLQRNKSLELECPDVVLALTQAGADPSAARFYQSPDLELHRPRQIAVLRVEDARQSEKKKPVKISDVAKGAEEALSQTRLRISIHGFAAGGVPVLVAAASYPIMKLDETHQRLVAGGLSETEAVHPDTKRACSILGTDALFEAVLKDYSHADIGVETGTNASLEYWLTDCRTGLVVWRNDPGPLSEERGWLVRGFVGGNFRILFEMDLSLPRYERRK